MFIKLNRSGFGILRTSNWLTLVVSLSWYYSNHSSCHLVYSQSPVSPCSSYLWWLCYGGMVRPRFPVVTSLSTVSVRTSNCWHNLPHYYPISSPCITLSLDNLGQSLVIFNTYKLINPLCAVDNLEVIIPSTDPDPDKTQNMSCNWAMGFLISFTSGQKQYRTTSKQTPNTKNKTKSNFSDDTAVNLYYTYILDVTFYNHICCHPVCPQKYWSPFTYSTWH